MTLFTCRYIKMVRDTVLSEEQEWKLLDRILNEEDYERGDVSVCVCGCGRCVGGWVGLLSYFHDIYKLGLKFPFSIIANNFIVHFSFLTNLLNYVVCLSPYNMRGLLVGFSFFKPRSVNCHYSFRCNMYYTVMVCKSKVNIGTYTYTCI